MYLKYFQLDVMPFSLTPNTEFFLELPSHLEAIELINFCIDSGEGFIKIVGEVGTGKTLLLRRLLSNDYQSKKTALISNPNLAPEGFFYVLARELGIKNYKGFSQHEMQRVITDKMIEIGHSGTQFILFIDEAQAMPDRTLEAVRLLSNIETEKKKLVQIVLLGQPELDQRLTHKRLRQLRQRIGFSYTLKAMNKEEMKRYISHRLLVAGMDDGALFSPAALDLLFEASRGIPRLVNVLSHKSLLSAYGRGESGVRKKDVSLAMLDTEDVEIKASSFLNRLLSRLMALSPVVLAIFFLNLLSQSQ